MLTESSNYYSVYNIGADGIENIAFNSSSIVACVSVAAEAYLPADP
jgi:hypothetical protein